MSEQLPFGANAELLDGEQRTPCVLLLDVSGSMNGQPIAELNSGLQDFKDSLVADALAAKRVEVAIITFGSDVKTVCDWARVDSFHPPALVSGGNTLMGLAIRQGIEMLARRKELYKANGTPHTRPWLFLITDGAPSDEWQSAAAQVQAGELAKRFVYYSVGVEGANFDVLRQISKEVEPLQLKGLAFRALFKWLSDSLESTSRSKPGENVPLSDPTSPKGWATHPG